MKVYVNWDWRDIGIIFRFYKTANFSDYKVGFDFQILWFNLWAVIFKKNETV